MSPQEESMKKLLLLLIALTFLTVSCSSSKKEAENDADMLPDCDEEEDYDDEDEDDEYELIDEDENYGGNNKGSGWEQEPEKDSPCENFAHTDGMIRYNKDGSFECGCAEGYFWGHLGCKKITPANICTGQEYCYDWYNYTHQCADAGNLSGQDPYYSGEGYCLEQNFSKKTYYNDETIINDNNLHISWMTKISPDQYTWEKATEYCENLKYGGRDDWRLPLPEELMSITSKLHDDVYLWSSAVLEGNDTFAWCMNNSQSIELRNRQVAAYVRCVRGKPIDETESLPLLFRFQIIELNNVEIVRDLKSGIIWQKNFSKGFGWSDSMVFCEHSDYAGFSDWRLPNINELVSLTSYQKGGSSEFPADSSLLSFMSYLWSSTTNENISSLPAYGLDLRTGLTLNMSRQQYSSIVARASCIRNEPCRDGYWWNGRKCAKSPCDTNPCEKIEHSDGTCGTDDFESYYCGCAEGWAWNGKKCVDSCSENPCAKHEHTTGECRTISAASYICGCEENYYWWGKNKGCLEKRPAIANLCTGQTHCYDFEKKIKCPAEGEEYYGQDAQYAELGTCVPKNYKVNYSVENEPVVYDLNTNLEWQGKINSVKYLSWSMSSSYCEDLDYGGYSDWRLPTFDELKTILDFDALPLVSAKYFPDTPAEMFWSSSFLFEGNVYTVNFEDAYLGEFTLTDSYSGQEWMRTSAVRCVRGAIFEDEPRRMAEIHSGEGTFYGDSVMGLLWTKIIPDHENQVVWADFLKYCEDLTALGLSDWRLANINELRGISLEGRYTRFGISSTSQLVNTGMAFGSHDWSKDYYPETYIVCVTDNPCTDGKIWNGEKCIDDKCRHDLCATMENSSGACILSGEYDSGYLCGCYEKYHWDSESQKCVADEIPDETSDADTEETPDSDGI